MAAIVGTMALLVSGGIEHLSSGFDFCLVISVMAFSATFVLSYSMIMKLVSP